jgi:hypothetical protein
MSCCIASRHKQCLVFLLSSGGCIFHEPDHFPNDRTQPLLSFPRHGLQFTDFLLQFWDDLVVALVGFLSGKFIQIAQVRVKIGGYLLRGIRLGARAPFHEKQQTGKRNPNVGSIGPAGESLLLHVSLKPGSQTRSYITYDVIIAHSSANRQCCDV